MEPARRGAGAAGNLECPAVGLRLAMPLEHPRNDWYHQVLGDVEHWCLVKIAVVGEGAGTHGAWRAKVKISPPLAGRPEALGAAAQRGWGPAAARPGNRRVS